MRFWLAALTLCFTLFAVAGESGSASQQISPPSASHPALQPYHAVYTARYNRMPIEAHRHLRVDGKRLTLVTEARNLLGQIHEAEHFHIDSEGRLIPESYVYDRSILGSSRKETTSIDARSRVSVSHRKGEETVLDFEPGQLGPLSYQLAMAIDLGTHDQAEDVDQLSYTVIHRGRLKDYAYRIVEQDVNLDTPLGNLNTLKVERVRDDDDRRTVLWLAPDLNYLPVRLVQAEDGETYEMNIKSFTLEP
ncbi:MAG TPA: DUF3108 domain-containing protein [Porticoccaceae bacterium]